MTTTTATSKAWMTDADFRRIAQTVYDHCGIDLNQGDGKRELVRARLAKLLRNGAFDAVAPYLDHVLADRAGPDFAALIDALSTNLTSFFRERQHFDFLEQQFLPPLLARKRARGDKQVLVWCAGCSSGEEAYSLAMTLLDATAGGAGWDVKILATDICHRVLRTAAAGAYEAAKIQPVPPLQRQRYLADDGRGGVRAGPAVRQLIRFRHLNLMASWPFTGPFDFIFCRNVMIYFDKPTQERLVNRYHDCLSPGGLLFTGHSESLGKLKHPYEYVAPAVYRKA